MVVPAPVLFFDMRRIIVVGSGNAALCAAIAALENGAKVIIVEAANANDAGGNSKYTAGAMRFVYNNNNDLLPLLQDPNDSRLPKTEFGSYTKEKFKADLLGFNDGKPLSLQQEILIEYSLDTMKWLADHNVKFEPIYSRQSFQKDGKFVFWGGLTLAAKDEGVGLVEAELNEFLRLNGQIHYERKATAIIQEDGVIKGVVCDCNGEEKRYKCDAVILGCGGFEASNSLRKKYMGDKWEEALVRGTRYNLGAGIEMALEIGAAFEGKKDGCHAVPMDMHMPNYGTQKYPTLKEKITERYATS